MQWRPSVSLPCIDSLQVEQDDRSHPGNLAGILEMSELDGPARRHCSWPYSSGACHECVGCLQVGWAVSLSLGEKQEHVSGL
jgi:hypothetical protein